MISNVLIHLVLAAASASTIDWTLDHSSLSSTNVHDTLLLYVKDTGQKQEIGFTVHGATYRIVAGSEADAPWSSPFTPLSSNSYPVSASSPGYIVGVGQTLEVYIEFTRQTGLERWLGADGQTVIIAERTRLWDTPSPAIINIVCQ